MGYYGNVSVTHREEGELGMSWIDDKANAELGRIRDAKEQQVYPLFRAFEGRRPARATIRASRSSSSAPTTTSA